MGNLKQKLKGLKKIPQIFLLSAGIASAFSGCASSWKTVKSDWKPTGKVEKTITKSEHEKELIRKFSMGNAYFDKSANAYKVNIKEEQKERNYEINHFSEKKELERIVVEQREVTPIWAAALPVAGIFVGAWAGDAFGEDPKEGEVNKPALFGALGGLGLGLVLAPQISHKETRTRETGAKSFEQYNNDAQKKFLNENIIYKGNAKSINVEFSTHIMSRHYKTDSNGDVNLSEFLELIDSLNPNYFFKSSGYSSDELETKIKNISLVKQIKPQTLELLMYDLTKEIIPMELYLDVKTVETPSKQNEQIENELKKFKIKGYFLDNDSVYKVVKDFVNDEINSNIRPITFNVKDITTRVPIRGANLILDSDALSKSELANKYFTNNLKEYAQRQINDYLCGTTIKENSAPRTMFHAYVPSTISVEVTHPDYKYVLGKIKISGEEKRTVYMLDKGQKIRVEEEVEQGGRIE